MQFCKLGTLLHVTRLQSNRDADNRFLYVFTVSKGHIHLTSLLLVLSVKWRPYNSSRTSP